jgi:hypothetical protein
MSDEENNKEPDTLTEVIDMTDIKLQQVQQAIEKGNRERDNDQRD